MHHERTVVAQILDGLELKEERGWERRDGGSGGTAPFGVGWRNRHLWDPVSDRPRIDATVRRDNFPFKEKEGTDPLGDQIRFSGVWTGNHPKSSFVANGLHPVAFLI